MKLSHKIIGGCVVLLMLLPLLPITTLPASSANTFQNIDFIEAEQPELNEETKQLISLYQKTPTEENYRNLRDMVIKNYNAVLERKEAKLAQLKTETSGKPGGVAIVAEMEEIVQEMYITYWNRINSSMLRFSDTRLLKWKITNASQYEYIPVMGAGESIYIGRTSVTNKEYADYVNATGANIPSNWSEGTFPKGEDDYPVNYVSYNDAQAYCAWLTQVDGVNTYRLPNESEWELAAGHMPKDADFNCGVNDGRTSVEQYGNVTRGAHGAIDFWGNVWEWTSTQRSNLSASNTLGVKGGAWNSERTECRTEHRKEGRESSNGYEDVGFRVIQVLKGEEPAQKVELSTLEAPVVSIESTLPNSISLSWPAVTGATEYQIFEYYKKTGLVQMLQTVKETSITMSNLTQGNIYGYIVQPISYVEVADNVNVENSVFAICGGSESSITTSQMEAVDINELKGFLYTPQNATENMPLIVYLHGVNGKGDELSKLQATDNFVQWLTDGTLGDMPAYVFMPQLPSNQNDWSVIKEKVVSAVNDVIANYKIDNKNVSLTGFSMGGAGVWNIAASYPEMFRAIAPCSGGIRGNKTVISALSKLNVWTFVGTDDTVVKPQATIDFMKQLSNGNSKANITEFEGATHTDVPSLVYLSDEINLIDWLIGK